MLARNTSAAVQCIPQLGLLKFLLVLLRAGNMTEPHTQRFEVITFSGTGTITSA